MPRCHPTRRATLGAFAGALIGSASTLFSAPLLTSTMALAPLLAPTAAHAQAARPVPIPANTLRGEITFGLPPEIVLNGKLLTRLSPASRIRGQSNTLVMSGTLGGQTHVVNYNVDGQSGLIQDVWLLTAQEASRTWPTTPEEAAKWAFDPVSQSWSKP
jgi:hypothetical protein